MPGSVLEVISLEELNKLEEHEAQLALIVSKFHDAYKDYQSEKLIIPQSDPVVLDPIEKVQYDDLSTQTDFIADACIHKSTDTIGLSKDSQTKSTDDLQSVHHEIFAELERKVKSTFNFEIDAAIKKSTESINNLLISSNQAGVHELEKALYSKDNLIDEQSMRITEVQTKLSKQISDDELKNSLLIADNVEAERKLRCEQLKVKELDTKLEGKEAEISKLKTKVSNQSKTNSQQQIAMNAKCKEIEKLKKEAKKILNEQCSQSEVNKLKSKIRLVLKLIVDF